MTTIQIQKGQTLGQIARQYHTSVDALARANHLKNPDKIVAGQKLSIPDSFSKASGPASVKIQKGQTLSEIARQQHTTVDNLVKLNHLKSPDKIIAGKQLIVRDTAAKPSPAPTPARPTPSTSKASPAPAPTPARPTPSTQAPSRPQPSQPSQRADGFDTGKKPQVSAPVAQPQKTAPAKSAEFTENGRTFPSSNGYPIFAQGKNSVPGEREPWADMAVGSSNVSAIGCAMTAVTMGVSGISGQTITPAEMNKFMNKIGGFDGDGNLQKWDRMGELGSPGVKVTRQSHSENFNADKIDQELAAGKPVVVQVDYKMGRGKNSRAGHDGQGDHWLLVTGKTADGKYQANDPASGKAITLHRTQGGKLEADKADNKYNTPYRTTGQAATFDRGPAARPSEKPAPSPAQKPAPSPAQKPAVAASSTQKAQGALQEPSAEVESAIREASSKVGVDYGYMKAMAQQESRFKPGIEAKTSSATGLYQFLAQTWLGSVKQQGAKYGLGDVANKITLSDKKWVVANPAVKQQILDLRKDPKLAALMGAEFAKSNQVFLEKGLGRKVGATDLYMAHFLGGSEAKKFLAARDSGRGGQSAAALFPEPAKANHEIFYSKSGQARSLDEVYALMNEKIAPKAEAYNRARGG